MDHTHKRRRNSRPEAGHTSVLYPPSPTPPPRPVGYGCSAATLPNLQFSENMRELALVGRSKSSAVPPLLRRSPLPRPLAEKGERTATGALTGRPRRARPASSTRREAVESSRSVPTAACRCATHHPQSVGRWTRVVIMTTRAGCLHSIQLIPHFGWPEYPSPCSNTPF